MQSKRERTAFLWDTGAFLFVQSMLFAGFTGIVETQAIELLWALPITGMTLCIYWAARSLKRRAPLLTLFFTLVFSIIWFLCLPIDHVTVFNLVFNLVRESIVTKLRFY